MKLLDELHDLFFHAKGYLTISRINRISTNKILIDDIASQYGYYPVYKNRSNTILGYGDESYSDQWATSNKLDQSEYA